MDCRNGTWLFLQSTVLEAQHGHAYVLQPPLGGSSPQAMFHYRAALGKVWENKPRACQTSCYPISAHAASARGRHIPGITQ